MSFRQLADWLDVQDPDVLARLRTLKVGQAPAEGWNRFLASASAKASSTPGTTPSDQVAARATLPSGTRENG